MPGINRRLARVAFTTLIRVSTYRQQVRRTDRSGASCGKLRPVELPDLPPRVPEELPELERALVLLNALRQAGKLKDKHRIELESLVGCRVTQQLAKHWGTHLAEIRRDLAAEMKSDPEG